MMDNFTAKIGEKYATPDGTVLVVWHITEAGSMGRSRASGPLVWLHCRPGGYSMTADRTNCNGLVRVEE